MRIQRTFFLALLLHVFGHFLFYKFKKKTEARVILLTYNGEQMILILVHL